MLWAGLVQAQSTKYVYDANGRVVAVTAANGTSVQYSYDTLGHASQISPPLLSGQMAIFAFMPTHGEAGTQVTIQGQGFDSNAANDTVSFNGTVATVLSATARQLVAAVPSSASTGPISVTADGQTAISATPFVVDDTGVPPSITQVSPMIVSVGSSVTIMGAHLDPVSGDTTVQMGGNDVLLSSTADTQLQYTVPSNGTSGYVTVETPYGQAVSSSPLIVAPNGISVTNITSAAFAESGSTVNLTISAGGQTGAMLFQGHTGDWISVQVSAITTTANTINYAVYAPGNQLIQQGTVSSAAPSIHLPQLRTSGTYLVTFTPNTAGAQMTVGYEHASTLAMGTATTVVTSIPGQGKRLLFQAAAGQTMTLVIGNAQTNPSGQAVSYTVYTPSQQSYTSGSTATSNTINLPALPESGTYQVIVATGSGVTGSMQLELVPGIQDTLSTNGQSSSDNGDVAGQNVVMTFNAQQGDNLELTLSGTSIHGSSGSLTVNVYDANGVNISSGGTECYNTWTCRYPLWNLAAGTYTVIVSPPDANTTIGFTSTLSPDIVGPALSLNTPATVNLDLGQVERLTFTANAGNSLVLGVSNATTSNPSGLSVTVSVYGPDNTPITINNAYTTAAISGTGNINLVNLPVSGTYTAVVSTSGVPGAAQLTLASVAPQTILENGSSQSYTAAGAGQSIFLTFTANQGDNLELSFNGIAGAGSGSLTVNVYNAQGVNIASGADAYDGWSTRYPLWNLAAGTYTIVISPPDTSSTISFDLMLLTDTLGPALSTNTPVTVNLGLGQVERLTFTANAGDNVALNVSGASTSNPSGLPVTVNVYSPGTSPITLVNSYTTAAVTGFDSVNLMNLPASGTYTVVVFTSGVPGTAQLTLMPISTQSIPTNGTLQAFSANGPGQNVSMRFTANQGDNLELTLSGVTGAGSGSLTVNVYDSNGVNIASGAEAYNGWTTRYPLWNLPAGTYTVVVSPPSASNTIAFNVMLQPDTAGPVMALNNPVAVNLGLGQVERLTFQANVGDSIALNVSGASTSNPSGLAVTVSVYSPDQNPITVGGVYVSAAIKGSNSINLSNLPVSGTYTVIVNTSGVPGAAQLTLAPITPQAISLNGATQAYSANGPGQSVFMTFTANQGDNLELSLSGITGAGSGSLMVNVYDSNGVNVVSSGADAYNGWTPRFALWNLVAGTYTVVVSPPDLSSSIAFDASLQSDTLGPALTANQSVTTTLALGQVERLTFAANAGDNYVLNVSGASTSNPSGLPVTVSVYGPGATPVTSENGYTLENSYATSAVTGFGSINLPNLPASGTYTVVVSTSGVPGSAQLTLMPIAPQPMTSGSTAQAYTAGGAGQSVAMTFNANSGDNLELTLSDVAGAGSGSLSVNVYDSSGNTIASGAVLYNGWTVRYPLWNLAAGTYTVVVSPPTADSTISFDAAVLPDIEGPELSTDNPVPVSLGLGQVERLTFNANAGNSVALYVSNAETVNPSGLPVTVSVYSPGTGSDTTSNAYQTASVTGNDVIALPDLPASGVYTVVVSTSGVVGSAVVQLVAQ